MKSAHPSTRHVSSRSNRKRTRPWTSARLRRLFPLALGVLLVVMGCASEKQILGPVQTDPYPVAVTPDQLMENFATAYAARDLEGYGSLLHEDFVFSFQPCDIAKLGLSKDHFNREDELASARNLFSGKPLVKSDGRVVPAVTMIRFLDFSRLEDWVPADEAAKPGSLKAVYHILAQLDREDGSVLTIRGRSVFFTLAELREGENDGPRAVHQLVGWVDLSEGCLD